MFIRTAPVLGGLLTTCMAWTGCAPHPNNESGAGAGANFAVLTVQPAQVRAGGDIELTLTNRSEHELGYNLCTSAIERQPPGGTQPIPLAEACTMELRLLAPGAAATFRHTLPAAVVPGTYRAHTGVEWPLGESRVGVVSSPFVVSR
jgi:hypothetical protein